MDKDMSKINTVIVLIAILSLFTTAACVAKEVQVTETYYETEYKTEYKTEPYTEIENVIINTKCGEINLSPTVMWHDRVPRETFYLGYETSTDKYSKSQINILIKPWLQYSPTISVYDLTGVGQIQQCPTIIGFTSDISAYPEIKEWVKTSNAKMKRLLGQSRIVAGMKDYIVVDVTGMTDIAIISYGGFDYPISDIVLTWSDDVTEQRTVAKERQVPYQVPVQVEKHRIVMKPMKVPFWQ